MEGMLGKKFPIFIFILFQLQNQVKRFQFILFLVNEILKEVI